MFDAIDSRRILLARVADDRNAEDILDVFVLVNF